MKFNDAKNRYLSMIKRQHSNGTFRFYLCHLNHFEGWLEERYLFDISDIKYDTIDDYIASMKNTCENATINKRIGILKRMYRELNIDFIYLQSIKKLKERKQTFDALDSKTYLQIRKYIKDFPEVMTNGLYHKCFLALLADTGARIQEIIMIEKDKIDLANCEILLTHTKTKEDRVVYFTKGLSLPIIQKMLVVKHDHKYLLHNIDKNRHAIYEDIRHIMRRVKSDFGIKKIHPHMFRHTVATHLIENGIDIVTLMKILGHSNVSTTERYLHISKKHIKKAYEDRMNDLD